MDDVGALPEQLEKVLKDHRKELFERLDLWLSSCYDSRPVPSPARKGFDIKAASSETLKMSWESPDMSHIASSAPTSSLQEELSEYELAQQVHTKMVRDFAHMQTVSEVEESNNSTWWARFCKRIEHIVDAPYFGAFFLTMVVSNSVLIGVSLELQATDDGFSGQDVLQGFNTFYAAIFSVEAGMRLVACGLYRYVWASQDWAWNWLDVFVVISSWLELILDFVSSAETVGGTNTNLRVFRLLRVGRLVRVVRVVRVVKFFRSLRTLVQSLVGTLKALVWSMVLLAMIIYIFAILFTDTVLGQLKEHSQTPDVLDGRLDLLFGSLYLSVTTLFRSISNGNSWGDAGDALETIPEQGYFWAQVLNFYIAFCSFAVLNVMTGVFCNSAIKAAERDHEMQILSLVQTRRDLREQVEFLFHKMDSHGRGKVTIHDFEKNFNDEAVVAFFESMEISAMDAWTLFVTLDVDGDHTVGVDEFVERCLQLHGPAKSTDLFALRQQTEKLIKQGQGLVEGQRQIDRHVAYLSWAIGHLSEGAGSQDPHHWI
ncbi:unnamed protein product [Durusdinium trenchii]|uniref:Ion transport domain-containing protein n=1 Tax=Durusdinium trenchii TaxID=1381693 RepID=A0ABP0PVK3_9DINO